MPFLVLTRNCAIQFKITSGSGLGLIQIRSGLDECALSVNTLKPDSIQFECALGFQCEQALSLASIVREESNAQVAHHIKAGDV